MIELIFVIVVIGILASTALPRLAATRDDAKMSVIAHDVMVAVSEIASYAVFKGETTTDFRRMSRSSEILIREYGAQMVPGQPVLKIPWKGIDDCIVVKIENQGSATEILTVETNGSTTNSKCDRLRGLIDANRFPIPLQ
jgi:general secretion pathway protein G